MSHWKEMDKWVKSLEVQLPATRRLREELQQERLQREKSAQYP